MSAPALWDRLRSAGIVEGEAPARPAAPVAPWFVRLMLGAAAWLAACFFLPWVVLLFGWKNNTLLLGVVLCIGAVALYRMLFRASLATDKPRDFQRQLALVVSLSGQGAFALGVAEAWFPQGRAMLTAGFFVLAAFEAMLFVVVPDGMHRILTAVAAGAALAAALVAAGYGPLALPVLAAMAAFAWLGEGRGGPLRSARRAAGHGVTLALLGLTAWEIGSTVADARWFGLPPAWMVRLLPIAGAALLALVWLVAVWSVRGRYPSMSLAVQRVAIGAALGAAMLAWFAPALLIALFVVLLGFANGNRAVRAWGLLALAGSLSWYYYDLQWTLLAKSGVLTISGIASLCLAYWLQRKKGAHHGA